MRRLLDVMLTLAIALAILEIYERWANGDDLTGEIHEWLGTARGRFASYYAERQRGGSSGVISDETTAPLERPDDDRPWLREEWGT